MRPTLLVFAVLSCAGFLPAALAQPVSPPARELRAQLEELQRRLDDLARQESSNTTVSEIGSSRGRSHAQEEPRLVVRLYDLSDLFAIAPPYRAHEAGDIESTSRPIFPEAERSAASGSATGGFGGGFFAVPSGRVQRKGGPPETLHQSTGAAGGELDDSRTSIDALIDTITTTISPDEWDDVGGQASITALGASLIVSAPVDTHDKIAALLDLFRKRWGSLRTISVQAHWLWLTEKELTAALADKLPAEEGRPVAFGATTDAAWQQLGELAAAGENRRPGYHAVLTCYNGQTVHVQAGGQRLTVVGMTPVVGGNETEPAYSPQVRAIQEGAALQMTPIATRTAKYVVIDVHSRVNLLEAADAKPAAAEGQAQAGGSVAQVIAALDRPALQSQRLSTTLRIPVGRPTLVGGMTFASAGAGGSNLYLFLTANVQELRDDEGGEVKGDEPARPDAAAPEPAPPKP